MSGIRRALRAWQRRPTSRERNTKRLVNPEGTARIVGLFARCMAVSPALAQIEEIIPQKREFLDTDTFNISNENCVSFLSLLLVYWDIDLLTFDMEIALSDRLVPGQPRRLVFVE
jgi:hypothetical protein